MTKPSKKHAPTKQVVNPRFDEEEIDEDYNNETSAKKDKLLEDLCTHQQNK